MPLTAIVGVLCTNGVVIGADSSCTLGEPGIVSTVEQPTKKISILGDQVIIAGTGRPGFGQRFESLVEHFMPNGVFEKHPPLQAAMLLSRAMTDNLQLTYAQKGQYGALVGFAWQGAPQLARFTVADFQPELLTEQFWWASMGSAQYLTDSFLALMREVFWQSGSPTIEEGAFATTWVLEHAIRVNPGGVNGPVQIAELRCDGTSRVTARLLDNNELDEHRQNIEAAKERLRDFRRGIGNGGIQEAPDLPSPP